MRQELHLLRGDETRALTSILDDTFALFQSGFPGLSRAQAQDMLFTREADLNLVRVFRRADGRPVGVVALKRQDLVFRGHAYAVFRMTAVVAPEDSGRLWIARDLHWQSFRHALLHPRTTAVFFGVATLRGYHAAGRNIPVVYPSWKGPTPPRWAALLEELIVRWLVPSGDQRTENPFVLVHPAFNSVPEDESWSLAASCPEAVEFFRQQVGAHPHGFLAILAPGTVEQFAKAVTANLALVARRLVRRARATVRAAASAEALAVR